MKRLLFPLFCAVTSCMMGVLAPTHRTTYSLRQFDTGIGFVSSLWHQHTTTDIGNPHGLSIQVLPFASFSSGSAIGKQFGTGNSANLEVISNRSQLHNGTTYFPYHALRHNPAGTDEEKATITLKPSYTLFGTTISLFQDGSEIAEGLSFQLTIPLLHAELTLTPAGGTTAMTDFFTGTYHKEHVQEALKSGVMGTDKEVLLGPITLHGTYNFIENAKSFAGITAGCSIATLRQKEQTYLFDPHSLTNGSNKIIFGIHAGKCVAHTDTTSGEIHIALRYFHLLPKKEFRILGVQECDGSLPIFSSFLLGGKAGENVLFPLANVLQREVQLHRSHQVEASVMGALTYQTSWVFNGGYGCFARQEEQVSISAPWEENSYAFVNPAHDTTTAFSAIKDNSGTSHLASTDRRYITADMLDTATAQSPAQIGINAFVSAGYDGRIGSTPFLCGIGASYEHGITSATPSSCTVWAKIGVSF